MKPATIFTTALLVGFSGAMMPGPMLTVTINESFRRGAMAGPLVVLGHGILEAAMVLALLVGLGRFLGQPRVLGTIGVIGGVALAWMGYGMTRASFQATLRLSLEMGGGGTPFGPVVAGVVSSISNPYWTLWWVTVGMGYLAFALRRGHSGVVAFYTGHIMADFVWYSLVALAVAGGQHVFPDSVYKGVLAAAGVFLLALAVYFVYSGVQFLQGKAGTAGGAGAAGATLPGIADQGGDRKG